MSSAPHVLLAVTSGLSASTFYPRYPAYLVSRGWRVTVAADGGGRFEEVMRAQGATPLVLPMKREPSPWSDAVALLRIVKYLRSADVDVVVAATPKAGLLFTVGAAVARTPARVYQIWGLRAESLTGWRRALLVALERVASRSATHVVANSESLAKEISRNRIHPAPVVLGHGSSHGVSLERFAPSTPSPDRGFVVGYLGRVHPDKGVQDLIAVARRISATRKDISFLIVGPLESGELARDLGLLVEETAQVVHIPYAEDPRPWLARMTVLALPTRREGFPNVVLEAAAMGIPAITTSATGAVDSVVDGVTGRIVPVGDTQALFNAILQLAEDPGRVASFGAAARAHVETHFSEELIFRLQEEFLRRSL